MDISGDGKIHRSLGQFNGIQFVSLLSYPNTMSDFARSIPCGGRDSSSPTPESLPVTIFLISLKNMASNCWKFGNNEHMIRLGEFCA